MGMCDLVLCMNAMVYLMSIPQCEVLHGFTRGTFEPDINLHVAGLGDFCV